MPTLTAPLSAAYTTQTPDEFVAVVCTGATDVMLVAWVGPAGTSGQITIRNTSSAGQEVGPFLNGTTVSFTAQSGSPSYTAPAFASQVQSLVSGAWTGDFVVDYIVSGLLPPSGGAIGAAALSAGVAYITGKRVTFDGALLALTATSDHYLDLDRDGQLTISVVTVGAGAPAKATNSIRLGRVTTNSTTVTARTIDAADSNGNWMGNYVGKPFCRLVNGSLVNYPSGRDGSLAFGASTTRYDNVGMHSETVNTSRITVPRSGLYHFSAFINVPSGSSVQSLVAKPFVDGAAASLGNRTYQVPDSQTLIVECPIQLRAGSYVEIWLNNPTAAQDVSSCGLSLYKLD